MRPTHRVRTGAVLTALVLGSLIAAAAPASAAPDVISATVSVGTNRNGTCAGTLTVTYNYRYQSIDQVTAVPFEGNPVPFGFDTTLARPTNHAHVRFSFTLAAGDTVSFWAHVWSNGSGVADRQSNTASCA